MANNRHQSVARKMLYPSMSVTFYVARVGHWDEHSLRVLPLIRGGRMACESSVELNGVDDAKAEDDRLVERAQNGQKEAFTTLVGKYHKQILRLSMRFVKDMGTAQDITQETFIKVFQKLGGFEGRSSFKSWLFQIAINTAKNKMRDWRYEYTEIEKMNLAVAPVAERQMEEKSIVQIIQREIAKLPFRQKTAVTLRIYEDLSFQEIAEIMECPYDTAKANYRHAIMRLKERLTPQLDVQELSVFGDLNLCTEMES